MQFASMPFLAFFLVVLTLHWSVGRTKMIRNFILLAASYFFYVQISWEALGLLMASSVLNYAFGNFIVAATPNRRRWMLFLGIGFNLGFLGLFKYLNFFRSSVEDVAHFFGMEAHIPVLEVLLPIGISFYTFQALTYLVDLYRGHGVRAKTIVDFALYQAFFPQLLIGPICRSVDLIPQIHQDPQDTVPNTTEAGVLILSGLFKKIIIATILFDHGVTDSFQEPEAYSMIGLWGGMIGYSIQLYCDFSGYTDLARGFALLLGFRIPDNFNSPYVATNVGEFWKRWHITFSQWLRDYIYIPLGGSRRSPRRISLNLFLTFLFCGFWHGASWGYIIWGGAHGIALAAHKRNRDRLRARGIDPEAHRGALHFWSGWLYTFGFVAMSRIVFVAPSLEIAWVYYTRMFDPTSVGQGAKITLIYSIVLGLIINFYGPNFFKATLQRLEKRSGFFQVSVLTSLLFGMLLLRPGGVPPYLYFQF